MMAKPAPFLLVDLGVTKSVNRPHCSYDNPYSESQFRAMNCPPEFPARSSQDYVDEVSHEAWPGLRHLPSARAQVSDGLLHCWYVDGEEMVDPVPLVGPASPMGGA